MKKINNLILIGSAGRNNGKTILATRIIENNIADRPVYAIKIISVDERGGQCHRQEHGCGICTGFQGDFELSEETNYDGKKDTSKLLLAGATKVFLLKTLRACLEEAFDAFLKLVPDGAMIVCESNSLRKIIIPQQFLVAYNPNEENIKPSARDVLHLADQVIDVMASVN